MALSPSPRLQLGLTTGTVPDANDLHDLLLMANTVDHAVGSNNYFTNVWITLLGNLTPNLRKILELVHLLHEAISEAFCALRAVGSDGANKIVQVVARNGRPDYLASHEASCRLTSS